MIPKPKKQLSLLGTFAKALRQGQVTAFFRRNALGVITHLLLQRSIVNSETLIMGSSLSSPSTYPEPFNRLCFPKLY
jgi:hypothetical protein